MRRIITAFSTDLALLVPSAVGFAAPIDHEAEISDVYAFRSYDGGSLPRVALVLCLDPWQEPGEGPSWRPFDPELLYELKIDNNNDAAEDIVFQFRFATEQRLPNIPNAFLGVGASGVVAPWNSPAPVAPGTLIVPPRVTSFSSPGLGRRQSYTVTMIKGGVSTSIVGPGTFFAVPPNVGPRTLDYDALFTAAISTTNIANMRVFAGTVDDPSFGDAGGFFDTFNLRAAIAPGVLTPAQDAANVNVASDMHSGFAVNAIVIEAPVSLLTRTGAVEAASSPAATLGVWGATSRPRVTVRRAPLPSQTSGALRQIDRQGNPLVAQLFVGASSAERFAMDQPRNDSQFSSFFLDPSLARILNALTAGALPIPTPPRLDLLPFLTYAPPIAAAGTPAGPVADLIRLNTGVAPTSLASASLSRLGLLGGDPAGYPNGRRPFDDVLDLTLRFSAGVLLGGAFGGSPNRALGDGVNVNDTAFPSTFPYLGRAPSGRDRRHIDPGEAGCTAGAGASCAP